MDEITNRIISGIVGATMAINVVPGLTLYERVLFIGAGILVAGVVSTIVLPPPRSNNSRAVAWELLATSLATKGKKKRNEAIDKIFDREFKPKY
jgi:hypothetical protein